MSAPVGRRTVALAVLVAVVATAGLTSVVAESPGLRRQVLLSTTRRPAPLAELFLEAGPAPDRPLQAGRPVTVRFAVRLVDGSSRTYLPVVRTRCAGDSVRRTLQARRLQRGERARWTTSFTPQRTGACRVRIDVGRLGLRLRREVAS